MKHLPAIALLVLTHLAYSQPEPGPFAIVNYFKVPPGKAAAYIKLEKEVWKPIHESRAKAGEILGWYIYEVDLTGSGSDYNFVSVTLVDNLGKIDEMNYEKWFKIVFPKRTIEDIAKQTYDARVQVRAEISRMISSALKEDQKPSGILSMAFIKSRDGQSEAFEKLTKNITQPVANDLMIEGKNLGWHMWEIWQPGGTNAEYNYVRVLALPDYASMNQGPLFQEGYKKRFPMIEFSEFQKSIGSTRDVVRTEIWSFVDGIVASPPTAKAN
jgi:hypothetical protein